MATAQLESSALDKERCVSFFFEAEA